MTENNLMEQWGDSCAEEIGASGSRTYNYVEEDVKLVEQIPTNESYEYEQQEEQQPVTDPRKPFVCQHCGVCFARQEAFLTHRRMYSVCGSLFKCQKCGEIFCDHTQMREHDKENVEVYDDDDEDEDNSEEDTKCGTFYCTICGLPFHRQDNLQRHQEVHIKEGYVSDNFEFRCMICGQNFPDEYTLGLHVLTENGESLPRNTCRLCGRTCTNQEVLRNHSRQHFIRKNFACTMCARTFHSRAKLKIHMLLHRKTVVTCYVCGEAFPGGRSLMSHRHSHSNVSGRQFPCRECGKTFGSQSSQQMHIRIHTGETPYGCRFCWKSFADGGTLQKHERIHTGEKPYACAVCPRAFNLRVVLRNHIMSHHSGQDPKYVNSMTPYCCSVCSDMFATSQDLILHLIHHCDMNTAMKRQSQVGLWKCKRRRILKPHELVELKMRNMNNLRACQHTCEFKIVYFKSKTSKKDETISDCTKPTKDDPYAENESAS